MQDIKSDLETIPVIDAHEHVRGHDKCLPCGGATDFLTGFYLASMLPYADRDLAAGIADIKRDDRQRWQDLAQIWPLVRSTGYGRVVMHILQSWGLEPNVCDAAYEAVRDRLCSRSPIASRDAYRQAGIEGTLTHYLAHPCCGGLENVGDFLKGTLKFENGFYPLLGTLPLHEFFDHKGVETVGRICEAAVSTLENLSSAIEILVHKVSKSGVVGLKDHAAYTRGLAFGPPDRSAAESEFNRLMAGELFEKGARRLSDYLFHHIVRLSIDLGIPMVIHTGHLVGGTDPKANVRHFASVLEAYPKAKFDLYHLNYPWFEDMLAVLKRFPNTWANCCWTHITDPDATVRFLQSALGAIPANRIFGFGGDFFTLPEPVLAHLAIARQNIGEVLGEAVRKRWCSRNTANDIARLWLYENPRTFYGIPACSRKLNAEQVASADADKPCR